MSDFAPVIDVLLKDEGGVFVPEDNGRGASKWGITLATARQFYPQATADDIARMDRDQAANFYRIHYWQQCRIGLIQDQALATKVFDLLVNMGGGGWILSREKGTRELKDGAITLLQKCAGISSVDGILGPRTAQAVNGLDPQWLLKSFKQAACDHYQHLVLENPALATDLKGWLARVNA